MGPEEVEVIPSTRNPTRHRRNEALGTGGTGWWAFTAALMFVVLLVSSCGIVAGRSAWTSESSWKSVENGARELSEKSPR